MKISELIAELKKIKREEGDIKVMCASDDDGAPIDGDLYSTEECFQIYQDDETLRNKLTLRGASWNGID